MAKPRSRPSDLRTACVAEALAIIESDGVEKLSLREVARRLGVSHQAPYKHFESRDHILAAVVARAYDSFAAAIDARPRHNDPYLDLGEMGRAYLAYASSHPLQYRLMFGTPLPDPEAHPEMMAKAKHAFALLNDAIAALPTAGDREQIDLDALFVWSTVHGISTLLQSRAAETLGLPAETIARASWHTLMRIGTGLRDTAVPSAGPADPCHLPSTGAGA